MYTIKGFLTSIFGVSPDKIPSEELYCSESNRQLTFLTNTMQEPLAAYSCTLVREGWLQLVYNGNLLTLQRGDLLIYSPGFQITIVGGSDDYHSVCLIIDEQSAIETPAGSNLVRTACLLPNSVSPSFTLTIYRPIIYGSVCKKSSVTSIPHTAIYKRVFARSTLYLCSI